MDIALRLFEPKWVPGLCNREKDDARWTWLAKSTVRLRLLEATTMKQSNACYGST